MRVILFGLLQSIGGWLATAALLAGLLNLQGGVAWPEAIGVALIASLFLWPAIGFFAGAISRLRERAAILAGSSGQAPQDGRHTVLAGRVVPTGAPLTAPMDGSACVMYTYEVVYDAGSGRRRSVGTMARGVALTACRITTAQGSYKLLAVPMIEGLTPENSSTDRLARFKDYVRRTPFIQADASASELLQQWSDDDGVYRSDVAFAPLEDADGRFWSLRQQHVPAGASVCVFGNYSQEKGGIVPTAAAPVRVIMGDVQEIAAGLRRQATNWFIVGIVLLALPAMVIWLNS